MRKARKREKAETTEAEAEAAIKWRLVQKGVTELKVPRQGRMN